MVEKSLSGKKGPPPLPSRQNNTQIAPYSDAPPNYDSVTASGNTASGPWRARDNRTTSTESLVPSESDQQNDRRKLLLVYIHGFMGNEMSFRSFPAHVHHLLTALVTETHVVHTKIYPRYRSKRSITYARDDFSRWLEPHEDHATDVVLLGHSMGGLLSAEVAIMPSQPRASTPLMHRILGTINFDVPFLGMHLGIVRSGLASIFMPSEETHEDKYSPALSPVESNSAGALSPLSGRSDTFWDPDKPDPNFNPKFNNDVVLPVRKGWSSAWHFVSKHSNDIGAATKQLVSSHMEFGGAMADFGELKARYGKVRALEETNDDVRASIAGDRGVPARVRFVNYWTASTGKPKKVKPPAVDPGTEEAVEEIVRDPTAQPESEDVFHQHEEDPIDEAREGDLYTSEEEHAEESGDLAQLDPEPHEASEEEDWDDAAESLTIGNSRESEQATAPATPVAESLEGISRTTTMSTQQSLPPIPDLPPAPTSLDTSYIQDPDTKKLVEKEHNRATKAYEKAVKDREKVIKDRTKLETKQKQKAEKEVEKAKKDAAKAEQKLTTEQKKGREKIAKLEKKKLTKDLTQSESEGLRLAKEKERMDAEGRRMRGEPEPGIYVDGLHDDEGERLPSEDEDRGRAEDRATTSTTSSSVKAKEKKKEKEKEKAAKPPKDRKFCNLPPRDSNGELDPCWVRVFMENVDEVGAHCGLFFVDERYERLVGDVAERIGGWVRDAEGERIAKLDRA
ncbi:hypothetical protein LTS14_008259 [Recurvomyces mirabilis]|uniref:uncharacterized protein n=1 Tax=Recurvomyces mirabilis TaxID=574656 RepID=UPI002DDEBE99|nr:hypothetical protein LTS14_008259 [Recurvomyces mirabilis]